MNKTTTIEWKDIDPGFYHTIEPINDPGFYHTIEVNQDMPQSFVDEINIKIAENKLKWF